MVEGGLTRICSTRQYLFWHLHEDVLNSTYAVCLASFVGRMATQTYSFLYADSIALKGGLGVFWASCLHATTRLVVSASQMVFGVDNLLTSVPLCLP